MNEFTHFLTGFLVARYFFKKKPGQFEVLFCAVAGFLPDFDYLIQWMIPSFSHGVVTHTILGACLGALLLTTGTWLIMRKFLDSIQISYRMLFSIAIAGVMAHLFLDAFTFYESVDDAIHHVYFWPLWDFPVHINTVFPSASYDLRVWIEVIYTICIVLIWIIYGWLIKKENPFDMLRISKWWEYSKDPNSVEIQRTTRFYLGVIISLFILYTVYNIL